MDERKRPNERRNGNLNKNEFSTKIGFSHFLASIVMQKIRKKTNELILRKTVN